ncbi:MAG: SIMPL domain-containing protein [Treponema sp.]|jgi:uncharacterized protein YggE|nr:SIMPL domain-containing protein [Treponema sp.]
MKKIFVVFLFIGLFFGCAKENNQSTIAVVGLGTVLVQPDMVQVNISLSQIAKTTRQAQEEVNIMVRQVLEILKEEEIEEKNIGTSSLRFNQEYEWDGNRRILIGQKVEQIITFSINDIQKDTEKAPRLLDKITQVNNIVLNQINFSVKDNKEHFIRSRELAYEKALEKAEQYAELSGLKIIKIVSLSELENPQNIPQSNRLYNTMAKSVDVDVGGSTILPTGEIEITSQIAVVFLLE